MKFKYLITFTLLFTFVLGSCNGQYNNDLNNEKGEQGTNGEENQKNNEEVANGEETDETLEKVEAKKLMAQYRTLFEEIVNKRGEDQLLKGYEQIEEVKEHFNQVMVEELAERYTETYFEERNGDIYIIPMDGPIWLKEDHSFELLKVDNHSYQLKQQLNSELFGHVYFMVSFIYKNGEWKIKETLTEEVDNTSLEEAKFLVRD